MRQPLNGLNNTLSMTVGTVHWIELGTMNHVPASEQCSAGQINKRLLQVKCYFVFLKCLLCSIQ